MPLSDLDEQRALNNVMQQIIPEDERPTRAELTPVAIVVVVFVAVLFVGCVTWFLLANGVMR